MANVIEDTENLLILMLIFGLVGVLVWTYYKLQGPDGVEGFSPSNLKGWWHDIFGGDDDASEYTPEQIASMDQLIDSYEMPSEEQVAQGVASAPATVGGWLNTLLTDPAKLQLGNSPFF